MKKLNITLPHPMADWVRAKVASGEYRSASDVVREGLAALDARNKFVQRWLRTQPGKDVDAPE